MRLSIGIILACTLAAQTFEVISVKPAARNGREGIGLFTFAGGRIRATEYTLRALIHDAYDLPEYRIVGGPAWVDEDRFEVDAKPPASSASAKWMPESFKSPPNAEMRLMLRALLADRFQLKAHTEQKKETVLSLVVAKSGPKLQPPQSTTVQPFVSFLPHGLKGQNATMDQLAERLSRILRRPVTNATAIDGHFDFLLEYPPDAAGTDGTVLAMSALPLQLGLKVESRPGTVDVLIIDAASKPSAN